MPELDTSDIQGLVMRGYGTLARARFFLLQIRNQALARDYLRATKVTPGSDRRPVVAMHLAFTARGLVKLEVPPRAHATFAREFLEGMDDDVRSIALGDLGVNAPDNWKWGRRRKEDESEDDVPEIHVLLLLYASSDNDLVGEIDRLDAAVAAGAFRVVAAQESDGLPDKREHFGFRDGISIPDVKGFTGREVVPWTQDNPIASGEFILGHENEYEHYTERPVAALEEDPDGLLPDLPDGSGKDLGLNGTYLVYRQLHQDVPLFWKYLQEATTKDPGESGPDKAIALAAKMVGRWPSGTPLIGSPLDDPHKDDPPEKYKEENAFTYAKDDVGTSCPFGAHIRRANPRDWLPPERGPATSAEMVRKHQILRRGRPYGKALAEGLKPVDLMKAAPDDAPRGLLFLAIVGHIGRQFEFVQRAWMNSPNFAALFKDGDPIVGVRRAPPDENVSDEFTCPAVPVRRKYKGMPQFTQMVGGAYFFLPGLRALRFILAER